VAEVSKFIFANNLALEPPRGDARAFAAQAAPAHSTLLARVVHSYLFFRVPLVRPARFLETTLPVVEPLYSRRALAALVLVTAIGLYFVSRQWDVFASTFLDFLSFDGALLYGASLVVVKVLHELGHAYTATRLGVRVNTMGVAFMVLVPIFYTDVTDAWRLRSRGEKLAIDGAGIIVELAVAGIATFLWAFLPDGPMRSLAFVLATTSWVMSLAINLNPLMRFDGYYLLADAWRMPNLQSRSNAMACWWLREALFGLRAAPPEPLPLHTRRKLVVYALSVWIYRFFIFLGIALLVYYMFFKALGIILFAVEIIWFILLPILREMREWWKMRMAIAGTRRTLLTGALLIAALAVAFVPWRSTVVVQGIAFSDHASRIYAPRPARVTRVALVEGAEVRTGTPLLVLAAPDLDYEVIRTKRQIELVRRRLERIAGDEGDRSNRIVLTAELARHQTTLSGLEAELQRLVVKAPHDGIARDVDRDLQIGEWIDETTPIGRVVASRADEAYGYVSGDDIWRLAAGGAAKFVPDDPLMAARTGRTVEIVETGARTIDFIYLASVYGGSVASDVSPENDIRPRSGRHLVRVRMDGPAVDRAIRGSLHLAAQGESLAVAAWRRILQVLVRESSA
jgi:putative peptide zinc metalloprotease protein